MEDSIRNIDYASVVGLVVDIGENLGPLTYVTVLAGIHVLLLSDPPCVTESTHIDRIPPKII
jgi:hypothetical protein